MNNDEYVLLQARMRMLALETLLDWTSDVLRIRFATIPAPERAAALAAVHSKLETTRQDYASMTLPWLPPEMSDLQAGEFQEIFDELSKKLERKISGGGT
jgi:hypothetical protein